MNDLWKKLDACRDAPGTKVEFSYEAVSDLLNSLAAAEAQAEHNLAIEHEANRHDPVRRKLDAAEAKLAMAVERIKRADYLCEKQDHYPYIRIELAETLRALGIDPSKETP